MIEIRRDIVHACQHVLDLINQRRESEGAFLIVAEDGQSFDCDICATESAMLCLSCVLVYEDDYFSVPWAGAVKRRTDG